MRCAANGVVVLAAWLLAGAVVAAEAVPRVDGLRIEAASIRLLQGDRAVGAIPVGAPIEALGTGGSLLVWQPDDGSGVLKFRSVEGDDAIRSVDAGVEAEAICLAPIDDRFFDLFLLDDDGALLHYWLDVGPTPALRQVRTLPVNPEAGDCAVGAERVYVLSPPVGIVAYPRSPETDPVMELVYAPPPAGAGRVDPAAFRLAPGAEGERLTVWDRDDQAWRIDPARPADASPVDNPRSTVPLLGGALHLAPEAIAAVPPAAETAPVPSSGDAADDPAVLVSDAGVAWIVGTNKRLGVHVYDLDGRELHRIERGRTNNVDAVPLSADDFLLAASNRTERTLDLYRANLADDRFEFVKAHPLDLDDPYGLCMWKLDDGRVMVNVGGSDGRNQIWNVDPHTLEARLLREIELDSQSEGCVYDAADSRLFIGEEAEGIWEIDPESGERRAFATTAQGLLVPDVEGLDIYRDGESRWLVASSQGDDSFVIFSLNDDAAPVKLRVSADRAAGVDGVSETDGLAVTHRALPGYPKGILVLQDGRNRAPAEPQNFKIVDWREIETLLRAP